jgi:hypothetical protein
MYGTLWCDRTYAHARAHWDARPVHAQFRPIRIGVEPTSFEILIEKLGSASG